MLFMVGFFLDWGFDHSTPASRSLCATELRIGSTAVLKTAVRVDCLWADLCPAWRRPETFELVAKEVLKGMP